MITDLILYLLVCTPPLYPHDHQYSYDPRCSACDVEWRRDKVIFAMTQRGAQ
jgi:hypothetical protein